ncbi:class I tRNA ligase family protein, partial [Patescibacteria group bacterium]|nr:class I tRNA ligase family protein [Patescibacteria group bacterium]
MKELPTQYEPKENEDKIYQLWEKSGYFNPDNLKTKKTAKTYTIAIPPPNVTGELHMGHALNAFIQDVLIRWKRMQGFKTLWVPGTDHAGIATQNVVEKKLKKEGLNRHILGKEKFLEKIWEWREEYGDLILEQLKKMGSSCDWSRTAFTMDESYQDAVKAAFLHYYKKGWIYQGERVINWCVKCQTSLSDLELEHKEEKGHLWYIKYPQITVA